MSNNTPHRVGGGLKTVAREAYQAKQRETQQAKRVQFVLDRNAALSKQRDAALARLGKVRAEVRGIHASITSGKPLSDSDKIMAILERHRETEAKLVADVDRLAAKISA